MKVELKRLEILRTGTFLAAFYSVSLIILVPFTALSILIDEPEHPEKILAILYLIFLYPLIGFFIGLLAAVIYNLVARATGGLILEMDLEPVQEQLETKSQGGSV